MPATLPQFNVTRLQETTMIRLLDEDLTKKGFLYAYFLHKLQRDLPAASDEMNLTLRISGFTSHYSACFLNH